MFKKETVLLFLILNSVSCINNNFTTIGENLSQTEGSSSLVKNNLSYKIVIDSPSELSGSGDVAKISVDIIDQVRNIEVRVDGKDMGRVTLLPFQIFLDPSTYEKEEIVIQVKGEDIHGQIQIVEKTIKTNSLGQPNSTDCFSNSEYDACIFRKNPVSQNRGPIDGGISFGKDLSKIQTFGVKIKGLINPNKLENTHISVLTTSGTKASPELGKWNFPYSTDANHKLSQVMAYFWLNEQIQSMTTQSGIFYASNKTLQVDAYNSNVLNNAYFTTGKIVMGKWNRSTRTSPQEMALSAEIYLHEMGHANLAYAMNSSGTISGLSNTCATDQGCFGAIHEGVADIHAALIFPDDIAMAQSLENTLEGWNDRNLTKNLNYKMSFFFSNSGGEIHGMGSGYASILWKIYLDSQMTRVDFMKMFSLHLARIRTDSNFSDCKEALINISDIYFSGKYSSLIMNIFKTKGVN